MLQLRERVPDQSIRSGGPPDEPPRRRRRLLVALGVASVVVLLAASVAALTSAGGGTTDHTDRVAAGAPSTAPPSPEGVVTAVAGDNPPQTPGAIAGGSAVAAPKSPQSRAPRAASPSGTGAASSCTPPGQTPYPQTVPEGITTGPDGALWFTDTLGVGRITTDGTYASFPVSGLARGARNPIVSGPDGALWFGEKGRIGRLTTTGQFRSYPLPDADALTGAIVVGPDDAMWFTEMDSQRPPAIARIDTNGDLKEFPLPGTAQPTGITAGPDGALWVIRGTISRVSLDGTVTDYPITPPDSMNFNSVVSYGITAGPDGAIWFTTTDELHRMTLDGHDTVAAKVGTDRPNRSPSGGTPPSVRDLTIAGGDFWISDAVDGSFGPGYVYRVPGQPPYTAGEAKSYTGDEPVAMTRGPDGAIWVGTAPTYTGDGTFHAATILRITADGTTVVKVLPYC